MCSRLYGRRAFPVSEMTESLAARRPNFPLASPTKHRLFHRKQTATLQEKHILSSCTDWTWSIQEEGCSSSLVSAWTRLMRQMLNQPVISSTLNFGACSVVAFFIHSCARFSFFFKVSSASQEKLHLLKRPDRQLLSFYAN